MSITPNEGQMSSSNILDTALHLGEEAVKKSIALEMRLRSVKWKVTKARYLLAHGKAQDAVKTLDAVIASLSREIEKDD
jgi:hypothetical protein